MADILKASEEGGPAVQPRATSGALPSMDELVDRSVGGDRAALERLLLSCSALVAQRISRRLQADARDRDDLQDILQQTFVVAVRRIGALRHRDFPSFRAWLLQIADSCVIDFVRNAKAHKRGDHFERAFIDLDEISAETSRPSRKLRREEAALRISSALGELPSDQRRAVTMRWLEGRSVASVAQAMQRSRQAVRALVKRGLQQLRAIIGSGSKWWQ
jgi:RNA polymerase sigma-70 factor (ECF subfamily)